MREQWGKSLMSMIALFVGLQFFSCPVNILVIKIFYSIKIFCLTKIHVFSNRPKLLVFSCTAEITDGSLLGSNIFCTIFCLNIIDDGSYCDLSLFHIVTSITSVAQTHAPEQAGHQI